MASSLAGQNDWSEILLVTLFSTYTSEEYNNKHIVSLFASHKSESIFVQVLYVGSKYLNESTIDTFQILNISDLSDNVCISLQPANLDLTLLTLLSMFVEAWIISAFCKTDLFICLGKALKLYWRKNNLLFE